MLPTLPSLPTLLTNTISSILVILSVLRILPMLAFAMLTNFPISSMLLTHVSYNTMIATISMPFIYVINDSYQSYLIYVTSISY